jgi:hypothetical protein
VEKALAKLNSNPISGGKLLSTMVAFRASLVMMT